MSCSGVDIEEAFQIAYLTIHGWEYTKWSEWTKDGFIRNKSQHRAGCSCCREEVTTTAFSTADAFDAQKASEF